MTAAVRPLKRLPGSRTSSKQIFVPASDSVRRIRKMLAFAGKRNSRADAADALARYRRALSLGGTVPLPALFEAAGAQLVFDPAGVGSLVQLVEDAIAEEEDRLAALSG